MALVGQEYRLRAMKILERRIQSGLTQQELANEFGVSIDTIQRSLAYARREGLTIQYEEQILSDLVPTAIKVYRDKLNEGDAFVAKDVLDKMAKLGDRFAAKEETAQELSLKAYLDSKKLEAKEKKDNGTSGTNSTETTTLQSLPPIDAAVITERDFSELDHFPLTTTGTEGNQ